MKRYRIDPTPVLCIFCGQVDEPGMHDDSKCPAGQPVRIEYHQVDPTPAPCGGCAELTILLDDGRCVTCSPARPVDDPRYDIPAGAAA